MTAERIAEIRRLQEAWLRLPEERRRTDFSFVFHKVGEIRELLDALEAETTRADELQADYDRASDFISKHLRENHGCVDCPSRSGWCESPNMKERCGRALVADRNEWRKRAEAAEEKMEACKSAMIKVQKVFNVIMNAFWEVATNEVDYIYNRYG
jgi:hypothetical protein